MLGAALISVVTIGIGAALTFFSGGAAAIGLGVPLIIDGIVELFQVGKAMIFGDDFSFKDFIKNKAMSLILTCTFAGASALKEAGTLIK